MQIPLEFHHGYPPQQKDFLERKGATGFIRIHRFLVSSDQKLLGFMGESTFKLTNGIHEFWLFFGIQDGHLKPLSNGKYESHVPTYQMDDSACGGFRVAKCPCAKHSKLQLRAETNQFVLFRFSLRLFQHTFGTHPEQPLPTGCNWGFLS